MVFKRVLCCVVLCCCVLDVFLLFSVCLKFVFVPCLVVFFWGGLWCICWFLFWEDGEHARATQPCVLRGFLCH